jgi:CIC family chloride channel protein
MRVRELMQNEAKVCDAVAREPLSEETPVRDLMTMRALTIPPDAEVTEAAQKMLYADVQRLFVTEGHRIVGVISATDIVRAVDSGRL